MINQRIFVCPKKGREQNQHIQVFSFYIIFAVLAFLIIRKRDWQKIWLFSILVGVLVSIIAIFQQFNILSKIIIPYSGRPPSTMGGPIFLALYLLLLVFIFLISRFNLEACFLLSLSSEPSLTIASSCSNL